MQVSLRFVPRLTPHTTILPAKEWTHGDERSAVFSMQGKRDNNEDRAVIKTVTSLSDPDKEEVNIWAVMDGHGGQVSLIENNSFI